MFNLFKNKQNDQRAQFNKDFYQFLKEYDKLIKKTTTITNREDGEDFVKATNRHILTFTETLCHLKDLDLEIASRLNPLTAEQEVEKLSLHHKISRTETAIKDAINHLTELKSAYLQGLEDGYNLERN